MLRDVALVAVVVLTFFGASGNALTGGSFEIAVSQMPEALRLDITNDGPEADVQVVLHHNDSLVGDVVDRIVEVTVGDEPAIIEVRDLRADVPINVSIIDAQSPIPPINELVDFPNGSAIRDLPIIHEIVAPPLRELSPNGTHVFHAYPVTSGPEANSFVRIGVTRDGIVVVAWLGHQHFPSSQYVDAKLRAAVSRDGGRTFSEPTTLMADGPTNAGEWGFALDSGGRAHIVSSETRRNPDGTQVELGPTRHIVFDPVSEQIVHSGEFPEGERIRGEILMTSSAGTLMIAAKSTGAQIGVWSIGDDHEIRRVSTLSTASTQMVIRTAGNEAGMLQVFWATWSNGEWTSTIARSADVGESFSAPQTVEGPHSRILFPAASIPSLDASGTFHFAGMREVPGQTFEGWPDLRAYYVRILPDNQRLETEISGPSADRLVPESRLASDVVFARQGARIWLYVMSNQPTAPGTGSSSTFMIESVDNGITFQPRFHTKNVHGYPQDVRDMATFLDGRPLLTGMSANVISVMPLFDPRPDTEQLLTLIVKGAPAERPPPSSARQPVPTGADQDSVDRIPNAGFVAGLMAVALAMVSLARRRRS